MTDYTNYVISRVCFEYSEEKNVKLKELRGIGFDEIIYSINRGGLLDVIRHPNENKYFNQYFYVVEMDEYVYLVPFVRRGNSVFLKTLFPSRKYTKKYLKYVNGSTGHDKENEKK